MNIVYLAVLLASITFHQSVFAIQTIRLATIDYCPLMCDPAIEPQGRKGIMVDIVTEIFKRHGINIEIHFMPQSRGMKEVEIGAYHGFLGGDIHQAPKLHYPLHPICTNNARFFAKKNLSWEYKTIDSLNSIKLLAVKGFSYANQAIDNYVEKNGRGNVILITGEKPTQRGLKLLSDQKADAMIEGHLVFHYYASISSNQTSTQFEYRGPILGIFKNYLSFTPNSIQSKKLSTIVDSEMPKLIESGFIARIYAQYGMPQE